MLLNTTILYPNHAKIAPRIIIIQLFYNFNKKNTCQIRSNLGEVHNLAEVLNIFTYFRPSIILNF